MLTAQALSKIPFLFLTIAQAPSRIPRLFLTIASSIIGIALVVYLLWRAVKRGHDIKGILSSMIIGASIIIGSLIIANALS